MTELLVPQVDSLILVGNHGSESRLRQLSDRFGGEVPVMISQDLHALREARVVISATNAAHPIIDRAHLAADRSVVVCDLAVPGDVDGAVADAPNVVLIPGGRTMLPPARPPRCPRPDYLVGWSFPAWPRRSCWASNRLRPAPPTARSPRRV